MQPQRPRCRTTARDHGGPYGHLRRTQASGDAPGLSPADTSAGGASGRRASVWTGGRFRVRGRHAANVPQRTASATVVERDSL